MAPIRYLYGSPTSSYLICTTPRSGSTFLSEALASTGVAGRPEEYFQQLGATGQQRTPTDYLGPDLVSGELPARFSAPDGDFRVELMFDPRRFRTFGDYASWEVHGPDTLAIWARKADDGFAQAIAERPQVSLVYYGPGGPGPMFLSFRGRARVDASASDAVYAGIIEGEKQQDPDRAGVAVIIDVERVEGFAADGPFVQERGA